MNEVSGKSSALSSSSSSMSSMAIVPDKRPVHRPGGCIGILFQLFDWNRRFAKKKLFPKKLLPPAHSTKKAVMKFRGDDKMPMAKFLLIADENRGGFPTAQKAPEIEISHSPCKYVDARMCSPGLVARLMGLESMPTVAREKPRKAVDCAFSYDGSKASGSSSCHDSELDLGVDSQGKLEPRPQKLQKTGVSDRQPVAGVHLGSEAVQFDRSTLSLTRKQQHKLASPVKSPRLLSRKNSSRLMEAAVKILEPGLQNRSRAKSALIYVGASQGDTGGFGSSLVKKSDESVSTHLGPCKSCGRLLELADSKSNTEESPVVGYGFPTSDIAKPSFSKESYSTNKLKPLFYPNEERLSSLRTQGEPNAQTLPRELLERKTHLRTEHEQGKPRDNSHVKSALRSNYVRQTLSAREKVITGSNSCSRQQNRSDLNVLSGPKDSVSQNRNLNNHAQARMAPKPPDTTKAVKERATWERRALARKRRPNYASQIASSSRPKPNLKQRNVKQDVLSTRGTGIASTSSMNRNDLKSNSRKQIDIIGATNSKDLSIVSFTFNAPFRHDSESVSSVGVGKDQISQAKPVADNAFQHNLMVTDPESGNSSPERVRAITGDELCALLEQKIRELNGLDGDGLLAGDAMPKGRSTASILEELISALTQSEPLSQRKIEESVACSREIDDIYPCSPDISCVYNVSKLQDDTTVDSPGFSLGSECDQPSPVSILEASFSTDSCLSKGLHSTSGRALPDEFHDGLWDKSKLWHHDSEVLDSATSGSIRKVSPSMENISMMYSPSSHFGFSESQPSYAREVISNTELLFRSHPSQDCNAMAESSMEAILLDTLDALVIYFWASPMCYFTFPDTTDMSQIRRFLFDCIIEHLDLTYSQVCKLGYEAWKKLPLFSSSDRLTGEIYADVCKWRGFAGKFLDEIVEKEFSHLSGNDFENEASEVGLDIAHDILQALVNETVIDLLL